MRRIRLAVGWALLLAIGASTVLLVGGAGASHGGPGFDTSDPPYLVATASGVLVDPILSVGDTVGGYQMSGIPDGLGAYESDDGRGEFVVVMNHELGRSFPNTPPGVDARISRLELDRATRTVHAGEYLFTGQEGFERFCSATLAIVFGRPFYFTGEEAVPIPGQLPGPAHDGSSIVMDPESGMWRETAHFGHLQHENVVPLNLRSKWIFLTTEDDFRVTPVRENSYLYAYIADDFNEALRGVNGSLYVFRAKSFATKSGNASVTKGESVPGEFVPIPQSENSDSTELKAAAAARSAFKFDRLEDLAARPDRPGQTFFADTGKPPVTARGRIYQLDINPSNPTQATLKMILNGDAPDNDDIINPDNLDASSRVLMIQEDRESAFRPGTPANSGGYGRVMEYRFSDGALRSVARVNTPPGSPPNPTSCTNCLPGTWESSGIIRAGHVLGRDWWLLDVQAHNSTAPQPGPSLAPGSSTGENGQLLAIKVPGSQGDRREESDDH